MKKRPALLLLLSALALCLLVGCKGDGSADPPPDLSGDWIQPSGGDWYHVATIQDDKITIWWYLPSHDIRNLYWSGSFTPPVNGKEPYAWESTNNYTPEQLDAVYTCRRATREQVKTFTYKDGKITYIVTAGHLQMTYTLVRSDSPEAAAATGADKG